MEQQVVIAGGGPVGLWLAAELRLGGVSVTVVEERADIDQRSKALTIHPRTIEILASRGVHKTFLAEGLPIPGGHFGMLDDRLDFRAMETPFPFTLALPQARTEELLEDHALALGATIVRGHSVTGFTEHAKSVTVQVAGLDGPYELQAAFIIGCDGTRSTVRTAAGIDFPGTPSTVLGWLGDVTLDNPPRPGFSTFGLRGGVMVAPLPGGRCRMVGVSPDSLTTEWPGDLTLEELRAKTVAITGEDFGMRDPVWLSRFGNTTRLAAQYRRGRILLAGDAAHQHFPAGGVGMNVGIQDAHNLGWKLAATLHGWAPDHLLDTYHTERHPVGAQLMEHSRAQTALMTGFTPEGIALRSLFSGMIATQPALDKALSERLTALAVSYPAPDPSAHPLTGTRAPDLVFTGSENHLFSRLRPDSHLLLDLTAGVLADRTRPGLAVHTATLDRPPAAWATVRAALIRPDGHVAWAGIDEDDTALSAAVDRALDTTHRTAARY
ncbi:FAD-dependent monooxygenase [Streptomyces fulvorobeus]|uniref:2-polyprenyl-6-methoxyphenol hydroxylase-like FAD-dependent oxidoreductase n=1 Tax=Streptomyces fulvorobeus TaxID=284028 RepID=A0A7J0CF43_9ACTN|nr:FAD-dependent monooxygenase [Streptomyces fulvorobeus]NYE44583.1 2-polyprenyl-6-methoxyphenol hydroxylase-like FAD-dependent oxidoreductase [Streptomyces fulvorobeus]GFN01123.1 putative aromatic compound monooxygenase YhjG [Streptomyces fulvorobeus]